MMSGDDCLNLNVAVSVRGLAFTSKDFPFQAASSAASGMQHHSEREAGLRFQGRWHESGSRETGKPVFVRAEDN